MILLHKIIIFFIEKIGIVKKSLKKYYWTWRIKRQSGKYGEALCVNNKSQVSNNTILGNHVNFNGMMIYGEGHVIIGDYFHSGRDCKIITHVHNYDHGSTIPYDHTLIQKNVMIGECVWLGDCVTILGGVSIGEGAIIQACSTVVSNIPKCAIAGGHPAKVFKYRDIEHYDKLKREGKFS